MSNEFCFYSLWPLLGSLGAFFSTIGATLYMHTCAGGRALLSLGLGIQLYAIFVWYKGVAREATYEGHHTGLVQIGLRYGMILFIVSEVMFFLTFFWAFFHSSVAPTVEIGVIWPPKGIEVLNPWGILGLLFVSCGLLLARALHQGFITSWKQAVYNLLVAIGFMMLFAGFQSIGYPIVPLSAD